MIAIFAPVKTNTKELATRVLDCVTGELGGFLALYYYARVAYDEKRDFYFFDDEQLHLESREELSSNIERDRDSRWCMMANLGFAPAEIYPAVFADLRRPSEATLVLTIAPPITKWVEGDETTRIPFALFLARIAKAAGSSWFLAGPGIYHWRPLDDSQPLRVDSPGMPYLVGWKAGSPEETRLMTALKVQQDSIFKTTLSYRFVEFYPALRR
jgi:hypothetical protein